MATRKKSFAKGLIKKYTDMGLINDNKIDWVEIIGAPITLILIIAYGMFIISLQNIWTN